MWLRVGLISTLTQGRSSDDVQPGNRLLLLPREAITSSTMIMSCKPIAAPISIFWWAQAAPPCLARVIDDEPNILLSVFHALREHALVRLDRALVPLAATADKSAI